MSPSTFCALHLIRQRTYENTFNKNVSVTCLQANCSPKPDKCNRLSLNDDLFVKVPRTNASLRHSLLVANTLRCLTLFSNASLEPIKRSTYFCLLGFKLIGREWQHNLLEDFQFNMKGISLYYNEAPFIKRLADLCSFIRDFIFFIEFLINDGACMIYESNFCPSRGSKNSLLQREFSEHGLLQKNICEGIPAMSCRDLLNGVKKQRNEGITYLEDKQMITDLEHDQMVFVGYDCQNSSLTDALIDEFDFLKCSQFDTSTLCLNDWRISDDPNGSVTIGGLRSLCLNSCQFVDKVDRVGKTLYSFDGLFNFKRERKHSM